MSLFDRLVSCSGFCFQVENNPVMIFNHIDLRAVKDKPELTVCVACRCSGSS